MTTYQFYLLGVRTSLAPSEDQGVPVCKDDSEEWAFTLGLIDGKDGMKTPSQFEALRGTGRVATPQTTGWDHEKDRTLAIKLLSSVAKDAYSPDADVSAYAQEMVSRMKSLEAIQEDRRETTDMVRVALGDRNKYKVMTLHRLCKCMIEEYETLKLQIAHAETMIARTAPFLNLPSDMTLERRIEVMAECILDLRRKLEEDQAINAQAVETNLNYTKDKRDICNAVDEVLGVDVHFSWMAVERVKKLASLAQMALSGLRSSPFLTVPMDLGLDKSVTLVMDHLNGMHQGVDACMALLDDVHIQTEHEAPDGTRRALSLQERVAIACERLKDPDHNPAEIMPTSSMVAAQVAAMVQIAPSSLDRALAFLKSKDVTVLSLAKSIYGGGTPMRGVGTWDELVPEIKDSYKTRAQAVLLFLLWSLFSITVPPVDYHRLNG